MINMFCTLTSLQPVSLTFASHQSETSCATLYPINCRHIHTNIECLSTVFTHQLAAKTKTAKEVDSTSLGGHTESATPPSVNAQISEATVAGLFERDQRVT